MDKLSLIASMAATLEAGDRASGAEYALGDPTFYNVRAYDLYLAAIDEIARRDEGQEEEWVVVADSIKPEEAA